MEKIEYNINLSFNLGNMVSEIGEIETSINTTLSTWGINDKFSIRSKAMSLSLHCDRELTKQEKNAMIKLLEDFSNERFGGCFKVESFCRKPCNKSKQSVS